MPLENVTKTILNYSEALELKQMYYDVPSDYFYISLPDGKHSNNPTKWYKFPENWNASNSRITAPTFSDAFLWFTTARRMHGFVCISIEGVFSFEIWKLGPKGQWKKVMEKGEWRDIHQANTECIRSLIMIAGDAQ
jgi:hypothetical protein